MKNLLKISITGTILSLCVLLCSTAFANGETKEYTINGLKVIHKPSVKGTISARLFVKGGTANYPKEQEGIENLAFTVAMTAGTESLEKTEFNTLAEQMGTSFGASSGLDYGNLSLTCLKMYWDKSWELYTDAILNPAFREVDFNIIKEQTIAGIKQGKSNPDAHLANLSLQKAWGGTDYAKDPSGTEESISAIDAEMAKQYYFSVINKANCFLVVVGDISPEDLKKKIEDTLAKLPEGKVSDHAKKDAEVEPGVFVEDRAIETNYIRGIMDAPAKGTEESVHNSVAMAIMGDRFFTELRTKRSLSYAPQASSTGAINHPANIIYISTTDPKQSMEVMVEELNKVKRDGFTEKELKGKKQSFLTYYFMGQETNSSISMSLGVNELSGGWENADKLTERVENTTLEDVNEVMKKYNSRINWTYLGKEDQVNPDYFTQPIQEKELKK